MKLTDLTLQPQLSLSLSLWTSLALAIQALSWFISRLMWNFERWKVFYVHILTWCFTALNSVWHLCGNSSQKEQRNWYWNPSVTNGIIFLIASLPLRLRAEHRLGEHSPWRCPLLLWFVPFPLWWKKEPGRKGELKRWMKGMGRKWGVSFVFVRGVSRSPWEAIKYLVWAPRSMFH